VSVGLGENDATKTVDITDGEGYTLLMYAAEDDSYLRVTQELIKRGANVNYYHENEDPVHTPLHAAVSAEAFKNCKLLLESGAEPNVPDPEEISPLRIAIDDSSTNICKLLRLHGANGEDEDYDVESEEDDEDVEEDNEEDVVESGFKTNPSCKAQDFLVRILCGGHGAPISRLPDDVIKQHLFLLL
jgi:ankyrin repeat protein